ncbi:MAG: hypothetical protein ABSB67_03975 [Bryobacteraceae bacterium]
MTSDPEGASHLYRSHIVFTSVATPSATCYAVFMPPSDVYLMNDANTAWLNPVKLGTAVVAENSRCTVNGTASSVRAEGKTRTVTMEFSFKAPMAGENTISLAADDSQGAISPWRPVGTWAVR